MNVCACRLAEQKQMETGGMAETMAGNEWGGE